MKHPNQITHSILALILNPKAIHVVDTQAHCGSTAHKIHPRMLHLQPKPTLTDSLSRFSLSVPVKCDEWWIEGLNLKLHSQAEKQAYV